MIQSKPCETCDGVILYYMGAVSHTCNPRPKVAHSAAWHLLHTLWTKAVGTKGYIKEEWRQLSAVVEANDRKEVEIAELKKRIQTFEESSAADARINRRISNSLDIARAETGTLSNELGEAKAKNARYSEIIDDLEEVIDAAHQALTGAGVAEEEDQLHRRLEVLVRDKLALGRRVEELTDRYEREVNGLNNEGDPIGGDPPRGLKHQAADGQRYRKALEAQRDAQSEVLRLPALEMLSKIPGLLNRVMNICEEALGPRPCRGDFSNTTPQCDEYHAHSIKCGQPDAVCLKCGRTNLEHRREDALSAGARNPAAV